MIDLLSPPVSFVPDVRPTGANAMANALPETNPESPRAVARLLMRRAGWVPMERSPAKGNGTFKDALSGWVALSVCLLCPVVMALCCGLTLDALDVLLVSLSPLVSLALVFLRARFS